jgi:hypothetical protein
LHYQRLQANNKIEIRPTEITGWRSDLVKCVMQVVL